MIGSRGGAVVRRLTVRVVAALALGTGLASAQVFPQVHSGSRVRVRAANVVGEITGKITSRTDETFVIDDERGSVYTVPLAALSDLRVSRGVSRSRGALEAAVWGGGLGLGVGFLFAALPDAAHNSGGWIGTPSNAEFIQIGSGAGLVIGAALGAVGGHEQWEPLRIPASIAVFPLRRGLGLRLTLTR